MVRCSLLYQCLSYIKTKKENDVILGCQPCLLNGQSLFQMKLFKFYLFSFFPGKFLKIYLSFALIKSSSKERILALKVIFENTDIYIYISLSIYSIGQNVVRHPHKTSLTEESQFKLTAWIIVSRVTVLWELRSPLVECTHHNPCATSSAWPEFASSHYDLLILS